MFLLTVSLCLTKAAFSWGMACLLQTYLIPVKTATHKLPSLYLLTLKYYPHLTEEDTKGDRGIGICPRSYILINVRAEM